MHPHHGWIAAHFGLIVAMPYYVEDYPDMIEPAYIEFAANGHGEFAFGCVTGQIFGAGDGNTSPFPRKARRNGRSARRRLG
ncbi:hypothetical protein QA644_34575 (plasmid) [Rhizobium sp. CC1099]|uniref:hypothetical protein n=1 Tax=Rhizobium sp. CC1099 TaxID=3039160 RepID=UPI0024B1DFE1|nr:hypothetical protein [Rhizobium sp. CC1099]WFU92022.1 hypothetical protein QA644_34575 [Rhizobium sp. CC1099]